NTTSHDPGGCPNNQLLIKCGSTHELVAIDDENCVVTAAHQVFMCPGNYAANRLCVVTKLIRPHPGWGGRIRRSPHDGVHHPGRGSSAVIPMILTGLMLDLTHITYRIDPRHIGAVGLIHHNPVINDH